MAKNQRIAATTVQALVRGHLGRQLASREQHCVAQAALRERLALEALEALDVLDL